MASVQPIKPFAIPSGVLSFGGGLAEVAASLLELVLGLDGVNRIYDTACSSNRHHCFSDSVLAAMGVRYRVEKHDLERIPVRGPLIVVANHPFGGIDGIVLHSLLRRVRPDVKLMVTKLLAGVPEYQGDFLLFDNFGATGSAGRNLASMKHAVRFVRDGGVLGIFPAGEVSHRTHANPEIVDPEWNESVSRLIQVTGAAVLPVYFDGHNSALFQYAGLIHPRLRTALLGREVLRRKSTLVRLQVGSVVPASRISAFDSSTSLTRYLRTRTYILKSRFSPPTAESQTSLQSPSQIVPKTSTDRLQRDIQLLPRDRVLLEHGCMQALYGRAAELPDVVREIGRLREISFRKAGEGTGKPLDLDRFDNSYIHLFVWHRERREIVGAYRLGLTDELLPQHGIDGLYTATLFKYRLPLLEKINPAIELGRSFVRPEYQREYAPLLLLWKGIGEFVARHPRYKMLLGPVSISNDYHSVSKQLLVAFLTASRLAGDFARWVTPRNPLRTRPSREIANSLSGTAVGDVDQVDELVSEVEADRRGMPILLRQYLKLNAKLLAFNVDPDFGDVLDGLMLADLTTVNRQILTRYMGRGAAGRFLAHHAK